MLKTISMLVAVLGASPTWAQDPFVAEIKTFAFQFCPRGFAPLQGSLLQLSQNTALFSLLGTKYGGDGMSNFALPTAKPVFTETGMAFNQCIALQGVFPPREP